MMAADLVQTLLVQSKQGPLASRVSLLHMIDDQLDAHAFKLQQVSWNQQL